jgi:hypothetical protein
VTALDYAAVILALCALALASAWARPEPRVQVAACGAGLDIVAALQCRRAP